jgi:hypothetical protein
VLGGVGDQLVEAPALVGEQLPARPALALEQLADDALKGTHHRRRHVVLLSVNARVIAQAYSV